MRPFLLNASTMFKQIIFDLDGTLCDSFEVFKSAFSVVAKEFKLRTDNLESLDLRSKPTQEILDDLGVSLIQLPFVVKRGREEMLRRKNELKLFPESHNLLVKLLDQNYRVGILTSNSLELVQHLFEPELLARIRLAKPSPLFGKAKSLQSELKLNGLSQNELIYIGDETRDMLAAKKAGVQSGAVTYGYNTEKILEQCRPNLIFRSQAEIMNYFCA